MATQTATPQQPQFETFLTFIRAWERRRRWQQTLRWLPRCLLPGTTLGMLLAGFSGLRPLLTRAEVASVTAIGLGLGLALLIGLVWLRPRRAIDSARWFDQWFELQERVSTALELLEGRIRSRDDLAARQIDDASAYAHTVRAEEKLPFTMRWNEWGALALLLVGLGMFLLLFTNQAEAQTTRDDDARAVIDAAAAQLLDIIQSVAADPGLDSDTRDRLLEALQVNLETLRDREITPEEAIALLNDSQMRLQTEASRLEEQSQARQSEADAMLDAMQQALQDAPSQESNQGGGGDPGEALSELAESLPNQSAQQQRETAQALANAVEAARRLSPEAAAALQEALEALERNDPEAAQQALEEAAQQTRDAQSQQSALEQSSEQLQRAAEQAQAAAQSLTESTQQGGEQPGSQSLQEGEQPGGEEGSAPGTGESSGQQTSEESQSGGGQGQEGEQSGGEQGTGQGDPESQQSGEAGSQGGDLTQDTSGLQAGELNADANMGQGIERQYEAVYTPRRPGQDVQSSDQMLLAPDSGDVTMAEGEFSDNPIGAATVPYNQVFSDYAGTASEALNRGYVPLGLRDVVRNYFTSLAPSGSNP